MSKVADSIRRGLKQAVAYAEGKAEKAFDANRAESMLSRSNADGVSPPAASPRQPTVRRWRGPECR